MLCLRFLRRLLRHAALPRSSYAAAAITMPLLFADDDYLPPLR